MNTVLIANTFGFEYDVEFCGQSAVFSNNDFIINVEEKLKDNEFNGDVSGLIRTEIIYDENKAWENIKNIIINFI